MEERTKAQLHREKLEKVKSEEIALVKKEHNVSITDMKVKLQTLMKQVEEFGDNIVVPQ